MAYADDLALIYAAENLDELEYQMNSDLTETRIWFSNHFMRLSNKSNGMIFNIGTRVHRDLNVYYHDENCTVSQDSINCFKIKFVNEFKYLGIIIDNKLNFKPHICNIKNQSVFS